MDKKMMKLNDDDLENVSGGTLPETAKIVASLRRPNISEKNLLNLLKDKYNIGAELSYSDENKYWDTDTNQKLSIDDVLDRIGTVKGPFSLC